MTPKIYFAGPSVFFPDWEARANAMKAACAVRGAIGLYPNDNAHDTSAPPFEHGMSIYRADRDMIQACDGVVADCTPFRGPSADIGTVWEVGYAHGLGRAVGCFSLDRRDYPVRLAEWMPLPDGNLIDSFETVDSLMLVASHLDGRPERRAQTIGGLFGSFEDALDAVLAELSAR